MNRTSLRVAFGASLLLAAGQVGLASVIDPVIHSAQIDPSLYGHFDQNDEDVINGALACGPTSTANSFAYLQKKYGANGVTGIYDETNPFNTINSLEDYMNMGANGVSPEGLVNGKTQYLHDKGMDGKITVESQIDPAFHNGGTTPTWQFLLDQLAKGQDVEVGFLWWDPTLNGGRGGYNNGHVVTATGFSFTDTNANDAIDAGENASMTFIDPWGGVDITGTLSMAGGYLRLTYSGGAAGSTTPNNNDDNPGNENSGDIQFIAAESYVPEPASLALLACAALPLLGRSRRRD